ncbi:hypothetical protein ES705_01629 [subsurface metagenome]
MEKISSKDRLDKLEKGIKLFLKKSLYKKWQEKEIIQLQYGWMKKN